MTWTISKTFTFEAAHRLPRHDGKCQRLHGHSYRMSIKLLGGTLLDGPKSGMVMDYGDVSAIVKPFIDQHLDHWYLNESTGLENPTAEELARWIATQLHARGLPIYSVEICETCTSAAVFYLTELPA